MIIKCLVIFLYVILYGYAATETGTIKCNSNEVRCPNNQCKPIQEGCAGAGGSTLKTLLSPVNNTDTETKPALATHQENRNRTECRLRLHPKFSYECLNEKCKDFISQGTVVNVIRRVNGSNTRPVSVQVTCGLNRTYNVNFGCVGEIEKLQKELNDLSINKMAAYGTEFNRGYQNVFQAKMLVVNYNGFKSQVQAKLDQIQRKMEECDLYFEFLMNQFDDEFLASFEETKRTCDLPPQPNNGWYNVTKSQVLSLVPTEKADLFVLHYVCERGFALIGTKSPRCFSGAWLDEFPHCSAACKLEKKSGFNYHCPKSDSDNDICDDYVTVGSVVKVTRKAHENVTVAISCRNDGTFNISADCVEEIDDYQREFENPTMENMVDFETKFNQMKENSVSHEFETLVDEFHSFEQRVIDKINLMHQKAAECDIYLDLLSP